MLIRTTIVALHHANMTGNYTVLRDLGASAMQTGNTSARLAELFRTFRERNISLAPAVLLDARLDGAPQLTTDGMLRLTGYFPTRPQEIVFDLMYRFERGRWRIESLSAGTRMAPDVGEPSGSAAFLPDTPRVRPTPPDLDSALTRAADRFRDANTIPMSGSP